MAFRLFGFFWTILYDSESDHFIFDVKCNVEANTKRQILSAVLTLYDPLGFLSPVILSAKRVLQELWLVGMEWDEPVSDVIMQQWTGLQVLKISKRSRSLERSLRLVTFKSFNFTPFVMLLQ